MIIKFDEVGDFNSIVKEICSTVYIKEYKTKGLCSTENNILTIKFTYPMEFVSTCFLALKEEVKPKDINSLVIDYDKLTITIEE